MPIGKGYGAGKRGTHDDSDGATGKDRNMPAPAPKKLGQLEELTSSKRGVHDSDHSDNTTAMPKELRSGIADHGSKDFDGNAAETIDYARGHNPRRSHK